MTIPSPAIDLDRGLKTSPVVGKKKKRRLDALAASLQGRYGPRALRRAEKPATYKASIPHTPTGFPALDQALGIGGLPRGHITECIRTYTSGRTTTIPKAMAEAIAASDLVAVIDLERIFNPDCPRRAAVTRARSTWHASGWFTKLVIARGVI